MKQISKISIFAIIAVTLTACFQYDEPPRQEPVVINPDHVITIAELQGLFRSQGTQPLTIRDSVVLPSGRVVRDSIYISGQVVSSDRDGNIFREMFIQDETGGLRIRVGRSNLYNFYRLGQHVYIRVDGLTIGNNNGTLELGLRSENFTTGFIDVAWLINRHVLPGRQDTLVKPKTFTLQELNSSTFLADSNLVGTLVKIENVRFSHTTAGTGARPFGQLSTWANPFPADGGAPQSVNQNFVAGNDTIIIRTSGHARFARDLVPRCAVNIVGVLTVFGGNSQIFIRDLNDVTPVGIYTITIAAPTGGTIRVMDGNDEVQSGDKRMGCTILTLIATPNEGYRFVQWWDGNTELERTGILISNITVSATFVEIPETP
ncbi:MAG: DUF5689 domain-containing protein [Bacteroidales bacterium]|nr:DUF5689 domain-containing protein [Bacteroidales bacterium]